MPKNTAGLTGPIGGTAKRTNAVIDTGKQNNDPAASPDSKSSNLTPNLTARKQRRMGE